MRITDMKRIYIILFCLGVLLAMDVHAQQLAEQPRHIFQSTSIMPPSGTQLPMAAESGVQMSGTNPYTSRSPYTTGPRKEGEFEGGDGPDKPAEPFPYPIGDALIPLALLALGYVLVLYLRRRRRSHVGTMSFTSRLHPEDDR